MSQRYPSLGFKPGQLLATPGAVEVLEANAVEPMALIGRHLVGDWGNVCDEDAQANEDALADGARLFSGYVLNHGQRVWVITEADRSATTILLPDEY